MRLWYLGSERSKEKVTLDVGSLGKGGSLASLLSNHADEVMERVTTGPWWLQNPVENLFRALIDRTSKKQAIRRPQQFKELAAISNVDAQELRTIIDAFRAKGISFLMPPLPATIEDETTIDISHEALIRCWKKIADEKDGWLKRETEDGLRWSLLLADAREFATDPKRLLYSVTRAKVQKDWLAAKAKRWCDRYGGQRELVDNFLKAMLRKSKYMRLANTFVIMTGILIIIFGVPFVMNVVRVSEEGNIMQIAYGVLGLAIFIWISVAFVVYFGKVYDFAYKIVRRKLRPMNQPGNGGSEEKALPLLRRSPEAALFISSALTVFCFLFHIFFLFLVEPLRVLALPKYSAYAYSSVPLGIGLVCGLYAIYNFTRIESRSIFHFIALIFVLVSGSLSIQGLLGFVMYSVRQSNGL